MTVRSLLGVLGAMLLLAVDAVAATAPEVQRIVVEEALNSRVPPSLALAVARVESNFRDNAESHAGARGMMQLMPGTAREEAGKIGVSYMSADLTGNPSYNIRLGDAHFARLMDRYGGAYPLAIAAYNAGPGRVNQWLAANGDPRTGAVDWVTWIEQIPSNFETRYYVMRVIGNAVSYANMHPDKSASYERDIGNYLRR